MNNLYKTALLILMISIVGCNNANKELKTAENKSKQPNILWIMVEDLNPVFSCYGETAPAQQLIDFLQDRAMLVVLDNFEHLLDAVESRVPARQDVRIGDVADRRCAVGQEEDRVG